MEELHELHAAKVLLDEELAGMEVTLRDDGETTASHFEERVAHLKKAKTEKEKETVHLQAVVADYRNKLMVVNQKVSSFAFK